MADNREKTRLVSMGSRVALALALLLVAACGEPAAPAAKQAAQSGAPGTQEETARQIADLEQRIDALTRQSDAMRREMLSRLDQIDVNREALELQLTNLKTGGEVPPVAVAAANAAAEPAASAAPSAAQETAAPAPLTDEGRINPFLRFILLIVIIGAILFLSRIFFDRWGDTEDGEGPPEVETTTDLGKIRFPPGTEVHHDADDEDGESGGETEND